jgi:N-methylhydantoinase A/oxoprolinase/acetone carboxylase beta subunit
VWTVDIDVGGTLTDGLFTSADRIASVKVDTTPHDLTVCLFDCLAQGAEQLHFPDTAAFLENVDLIRWSTTITSNVLAELRGPRIGLLVSQGHERDLYRPEVNAQSASDTPNAGPADSVLNRLLFPRDILGLNGSVDETTVMNAARALLETGVRRICISFKDSHRHPEREIAVKRVIDDQYPDHFLGSVPVLAGSDISKSADDRTRTYCAVINAYTHGALAATLFKAEDDLRDSAHYTGSFLVSHINGGVAGIAKTRALDTIESGPVLGIIGSAYLAKAQNLKDVIAMDVGGTTAKISVLAGGEPIYRKPSDLFGIPVELSLPYLRSIALGGGSIVKPLVGAKARQEKVQPSIQLGPESMGSYPGPACYGLGGDQATLTDAFVTAGLINPDYFLGGAKQIDRELARKAIEEIVARPLNLSVDETCKAILDRAFSLVAGVIAASQAELQQDLSKHVLFAYGGNGGLFACGVAEKAGLKQLRMFALGPVFSAFGSSVSDISHVYERALPDPSISDTAVSRVRAMLDEMKAESAQDLLGEGIRPEGLAYALEFEVSGQGRHSIPVPFDESSLASPQQLESTLRKNMGNHSGPLSLDLFRLRVKKPMSKPRLVERSLQGPDSSQAHVGERTVGWGSRSGKAQIYRWEKLQPGNRVEGCAILEGVSTTYFVPEGWTLVVDAFGNASLDRAAASAKTN